jgi:hypothetical protein
MTYFSGFPIGVGNDNWEKQGRQKRKGVGRCDR